MENVTPTSSVNFYGSYAQSAQLKFSMSCGSYFKFINTVDIALRHGKSKAIPLQAWTGPEGSRGLRLPDFKTIGI